MNKKDLELFQLFTVIGFGVITTLYFYLVKYRDMNLDTFFIILSIFYCTFLVSGIVYVLITRIDRLINVVDKQ